MRQRRYLPGLLIGCLLLVGVGLIYYIQQRMRACDYVPLLADNLLPNADLALPGEQPSLPAGWAAAAPGVQLGAFAIDGDGRALQLIGIANFVQTPAVSVAPGQTYCFAGRAITDSDKKSATRLQVGFRWLNAAGHLIAEEITPWQPVVLWEQDRPPADWSHITAAFAAPPEATTLLVRLHPSSDDRVYLDAMHLRVGGIAQESAPRAESTGDSNEPRSSHQPAQPVLLPWPHGYRAAVSFSFDWETAMGGLIHSRSVGDPYGDTDPELRGMRMREGITTTLALFQRFGVRATYYANGYNFLLGNSNREQFLGNPTYAWATQANRWTSNRWQTTPWFALDPYGTVQSDPAWYFGDLIPRLQEAQQDIQSHTFSHFYGGFVAAQDWQDDLTTWNRVAAAHNVPPARSLAFPWSSSGGMSDESWRVLEQAGITSVTRLSDQSQYNLFPHDTHGIVQVPRCQEVPGHERILACPDFYLTPHSTKHAIEQLRRVREVSGTIDLWAHTEEVITPEQQAAWEHVADYVTTQGDMWVAPLREIADWQQALADVTIADTKMNSAQQLDQAALSFTMTNHSDQTLDGITVAFPFRVKRIAVTGADQHAGDLPPVACPNRDNAYRCSLTLQAGQIVEVAVWTAT